MLVLGRNLGDSIVINDEIFITVFEVNEAGNRFKVAIDAPKEIKIVRGELYEEDTEQRKKVVRMKQEAAKRKKR